VLIMAKPATHIAIPNYWTKTLHLTFVMMSDKSKVI
jgi:hypothetical protein